MFLVCCWNFITILTITEWVFWELFKKIIYLVLWTYQVVLGRENLSDTIRWIFGPIGWPGYGVGPVLGYQGKPGQPITQARVRVMSCPWLMFGWLRDYVAESEAAPTLSRKTLSSITGRIPFGSWDWRWADAELFLFAILPRINYLLTIRDISQPCYSSLCSMLFLVEQDLFCFVSTLKSSFSVSRVTHSLTSSMWKGAEPEDSVGWGREMWFWIRWVR